MYMTHSMPRVYAPENIRKPLLVKKRLKRSAKGPMAFIF